MVEQAKLVDILTLEAFERIERVFRGHFALAVEATGRDGAPVAGRCSVDCEPGFCRLVRGSEEGARRCLAERRRAVEIAAGAGRAFITICPAGIGAVSVPGVA